MALGLLRAVQKAAQPRQAVKELLIQNRTMCAILALSCASYSLVALKLLQPTVRVTLAPVVSVSEQWLLVYGVSLVAQGPLAFLGDVWETLHAPAQRFWRR